MPTLIHLDLTRTPYTQILSVIFGKSFQFGLGPSRMNGEGMHLKTYISKSAVGEARGDTQDYFKTGKQI